MGPGFDPRSCARAGEFTEATARAAIGHRGETAHLENKQKQSALTQEDKLELARHVAGFANCEGGFIVYGVEDGTGRRVGVCEQAFGWLSQAAHVTQLLSNHFAPPVEDITVFPFEDGPLHYVVICVPRTPFTLHMATKDGRWSLVTREGKPVEAWVFRKGDIPYRQGGQTISMSSVHLNRVLTRMLAERDRQILAGLQVVVRRPAKSVGSIAASGDADYQSAKAVRLVAGAQAADGAVGIDAAPASDAHTQISFNYEMWQQRGEYPQPTSVYNWYLARQAIRADGKHRQFLLLAALWRNALPYYWARGVALDVCKACCQKVVGESTDIHARRAAWRVLMARLPGEYSATEYRGIDGTTYWHPVRVDDLDWKTPHAVELGQDLVHVDTRDSPAVLGAARRNGQGHC